jgi:hypothetical protein
VVNSKSRQERSWQDRRGEQRVQYKEAAEAGSINWIKLTSVDVHPALSEWMQKKQREDRIGQSVSVMYARHT